MIIYNSFEIENVIEYKKLNYKKYNCLFGIRKYKFNIKSIFGI